MCNSFENLDRSKKNYCQIDYSNYNKPVSKNYQTIMCCP